MKKYKVRVKKICPSCGKEFMPKRFGQIYCSRYCVVKVPGFIKTPPIIMRTCPICKKEFLPHAYNQIYCNKECWRQHYLDRLNKKNGPYYCEFCGKDFFPKSTAITNPRYRGKYCSKRCSGLASHFKNMKEYLSQKAEWMKNHKPRRCEYCGKIIDPEKCWDREYRQQSRKEKPLAVKFCDTKCFGLGERVDQLTFTNHELMQSNRNIARIIRQYFSEHSNGKGASDRAYKQFLKKYHIIHYTTKGYRGSNVHISFKSITVNKKTRKLLKPENLKA